MNPSIISRQGLLIIILQVLILTEDVLLGLGSSGPTRPTMVQRLSVHMKGALVGHVNTCVLRYTLNLTTLYQGIKCINTRPTCSAIHLSQPPPLQSTSALRSSLYALAASPSARAWCDCQLHLGLASRHEAKRSNSSAHPLCALGFASSSSRCVKIVSRYSPLVPPAIPAAS
jgi:hypothetical protein